ncbi:hypothetical protein O9993_18365 [Vibrio lentus]|nr:hypothetical protein [Vibrio lentus]
MDASVMNKAALVAFFESHQLKSKVYCFLPASEATMMKSLTPVIFWSQDLEFTTRERIH